MKILVINGSPKGQNSVTLQYVKYLAKISKKHEKLGADFDILDVGKTVYSMSKPDKLQVVLDSISSADMLLFSYPVYTFLAPSQLHKFFEILRDNHVDLSGKYVTQLTTSKKFYDVTAHRAVRDMILSLGGKYIGGYSADMDDLLKEDLRENFVEWWRYVHFQRENGIYEKADAIAPHRETYAPTATPVEKKGDKKIIVVTDNTENASLMAMVTDFVSLCPYEVEVIDLKKDGPKSGCRGCLKCAATGECVIKDGFEDLLNNKINRADAVIMAFEVTMHSLSSTFKAFFDRQFVNGHRPVTAGKPTAYIVSGSYEGEANLQMYVEAKSAVGGNMNVGVVCDENAVLTDLEQLVTKLTYSLENCLTPHKNFYEVGGMRIFRDMIWIMRGIMKLDYDFYKKKGLLDFPQKQRGTMLAMKFLGRVLRIKALQKKMPNMLEEGMLMPYQKLTRED